MGTVKGTPNGLLGLLRLMWCCLLLGATVGCVRVGYEAKGPESGARADGGGVCSDGMSCSDGGDAAVGDTGEGGDAVAGDIQPGDGAAGGDSAIDDGGEDGGLGDRDGGDGGGEPECESGDVACNGSQIQRCENGQWLPDEACPLGCNETGTACARLVASNLDDDGELLHTAERAVTVSASLAVDTDSCGADAFGPTVANRVVPQSGGPEGCVYAFSTFSVAAGVEVRVVGGRPLVLLVAEDATIAGTIDVAARGTQPGPGGGAGGEPDSAGEGCGGGGGGNSTACHVDGTSADTGGSGGGHGGRGGAAGISLYSLSWGGDSCSVVADEVAGGATCGPATLVPLTGGSGGGGGATEQDLHDTYVRDRPGGRGGAGGGALQISAAGQVTVTSTGRLLAGGGGGGEGRHDAGGGGGGAGGSILLEGVQVNIQGTVAANGGGGGASSNGYPGENGLDWATAAEGGGEAWNDWSRAGAAGGADTQLDGLASEGDTQRDERANSGGGGGAVGRIRVNVLHGESGNLQASGTISPSRATTAFSTGAIALD
jgi:hypothetical protein